MREKSDDSFKKVYDRVICMSEIAKVTISVPRTCARQTQRTNVTALSTDKYWMRGIFIPYLDHFISQLCHRFGHISKIAVQGLTYSFLCVSDFISEVSDFISEHERNCRIL